MINPFKRFFGGMMIGIFLSIPFIQIHGDTFGPQFIEKIKSMSLVSLDAFLVSWVALLGLTCAWLGALATRKARPSPASCSTVETFRQRRQNHRVHHLLQ